MIVRGWSSVGRWAVVGREEAEKGRGVGVGGIGTDEERNPILIGVGGFLEDPTEMGVETLAVTMFGIAR
jgi:hypothetical protein